MSRHNKRYPNESPEYRAKRDEILELEVELRAKIEELGNKRLELPPGGKLKKDYKFEEQNRSGDIVSINFSSLFAPEKNTLAVYSYMYSTDMPTPCTSCTSIIDTLNANTAHITDRINLVIVAKSPIQRIQEIAKRRNWNNIHLISSANNTYNIDYHAENEKGSQLPALNIFQKNDKGIYHYYGTELLYAKLQGHPRHVDSIWPIWNLFDMTPEGRGENWYPKLEY